MPPDRSAPSSAGRASALLVAGLLALCGYRAATQSVSCDEALTWLLYLDRPFATLLQNWQANNHVLHTALAWCSVHLFGNSELALRLPALAGAVLCLLALRRLAQRACGEGWLHVPALLLLAANPLVLDFLVAARGYGLALGFLLWAALALLGELDRVATGAAPRRGRLVLASLLLGACVAANLAFLPAAGGLAGAFLLAAPWRRRAAMPLLVPGAVVAAVLLVPPMRGVSGSAFITGVDSLWLTVDSLVQFTLAHHESPWLPQPGGVVLVQALLPAGRALAVLLVVLLIWRATRWARGRAPDDADERALRLVGGALLLALAGLVVLHEAFGLLYPSDRTALFLLPLGELAALLLANRGLRGRTKPAAAGTLALLAVVATLQLAALQASAFALWPLDTGVRGFFELIEKRQALIPRREVQVRVTHRFQAPAVQFYRDTRAADWMAPVPTDWDRSDLAIDYLIVPAGQWGDVLAGDPTRFNVLEERAGVRLAVPKRRGRPRQGAPGQRGLRGPAVLPKAFS